MASAVTVRVDAKDVLARFSPSGIPEQVRRNLRATLPDLTKRLGARVESKLDTELKSRNRLTVDKHLIENPQEIVGRVETRWTGDASKKFIPTILESGARPHDIVPRNASALFFFWEKVGRWVAFRRVHHPGFPGIFYTQRSLAEMESEIVESIRQAVQSGAQRAA